MKFSKTQRISIVAIIATLIVGFWGYSSSTKVSVEGNGNATAVGYQAQAIINNNELSTYTWVNPDWGDALVADAARENTYALNFSASNTAILPSRPCLQILSDVKIASAIVPKGVRGRIPGSTVWSVTRLGFNGSGAVLTPYQTTTGMYGVAYCYYNPTINERFLVSFESTPSDIKAELSTSSDPSF